MTAVFALLVVVVAETVATVGVEEVVFMAAVAEGTAAGAAAFLRLKEPIKRVLRLVFQQQQQQHRPTPRSHHRPLLLLHHIPPRPSSTFQPPTLPCLFLLLRYQ